MNGFEEIVDEVVDNVVVMEKSRQIILLLNEILEEIDDEAIDNIRRDLEDRIYY